MSLATRLIRHADLRPCRNAFVDSRSPGSAEKENFTLIGPGVSENPNQHVHIPEPHGFNIGGARQPPGCLNSQHSHETAEVFVVHTGQWRFLWGPHREDGQVDLGPGDTISIPTRMFRGFENIGAESGFLFAVLGGDDPGRVTWSPPVFELAREHGLVLLEGGRLVDTSLGDAVPDGARPQLPPTPAEMAALGSPANERLAQCVARFAALAPGGGLTAPGVEECTVISPRATADGFAPGPIAGWWPHGFVVRCLRLAPAATVAPHTRAEAEVIFIQSGTLEMVVDGEALAMQPGDTFTTPNGATRSFTSPRGCVAFVVRGGEDPAAARFLPARTA
ncbi:MAG: cupin domain-containing protein [Rubritepida sp.]|nr:cupin domain-containing protein [Rubritepida sp.]